MGQGLKTLAFSCLLLAVHLKISLPWGGFFYVWKNDCLRVNKGIYHHNHHPSPLRLLQIEWFSIKRLGKMLSPLICNQLSVGEMCGSV
jgi:hypothetical protein